MKQEILVPRVNTNDNEVELVHWYVEDKQFVEVGQEIADVESSKAVMSIESEASGYIVTSAKVGDSIRVGAPLATIYTELAELEADLNGDRVVESSPSVGEPIFESVVNNGAVSTELDLADIRKPERDLVTTTAKPSFGFTRFSPSAKEYLKQHNLDASQFEGMGLVSVEAIEQILGKKSKPITPANGDRSNTVITTTPTNNNLRSEKVSKAKQIEINLLSAGQAGGINSFLTVQFNSAAIRQTLVETGSLNGQILPLILFEFSRLLEEYPVFNAYYEAGRIYYYDRIDIGLAMDLGKGLKVPILRNSNLLSPVEIQDKVTNYATQYLDNRLDPVDLIGGTVTVTDLSNEGILHFQPLLNQNQAIILGIGGDSSIEGYPLTLTVVFDHRLSAGREVASFLNELKKRLLSYALSNLPETQKLAKTKNVQCSKCLIDLHSLYQKYGSEALMQLHINEQGETDYICHVCLGGF
ncbi:2-oxoglutarate dehydrogenase E2 component [Stanieria cyanosphaera PCC 7437]|uniref:Dihydrolipoamide acetyltransferase component of pyruvate dehydrogenase complex n=1 Tax=Stanieria cyanosphaera (strain ATCC 29371 / PCC 7437) TaxID=111780 RepID=K9XPK2_STAC7|nr:2-oxo acid dehydrogenase subunit E2 [Stanieria cyanosphaera]AFZ34029.1 2-oxoglutarate dehydrogenase E2 component [Stanieria cyanosphaera PCC 7437]